MPLDGHSYLVAQGWSGKGNGLRKGAIAKPIAVNPKKTLAGLGKDRDEAFPFWDHVFSVASQAITVRIDDSDASDSVLNDSLQDEINPSVAPVLRRTTTGILSNLRPVNVTPTSTSGTSTPNLSSSGVPRLSLVAIAKREAAKRNLYSRFYRGAILAPEVDLDPLVGSATSTPSALPPVILSSKAKSKQKAKEERVTTGGKKKEKKNKRKVEELEKEDDEVDKVESKAERRERKRRKKEERVMKKKVKLRKQEASEDRLKVKLDKKRRREEALASAGLGVHRPSNDSSARENVDQIAKERKRRKKEEEVVKQKSETSPNVTVKLQKQRKDS
ncbi:hypothetical protein J3R30DRAFT_3368459 [Lentinula aciculospora]|uniref:Ribosome biogenesis protein n=1 Tax=Lentinula aciculospora TaxID=153920 RepID=A0A9W9DQY7_9AGAR|nr:hypothetical protein J3R30DRAFT_3368459 [Lentinula aciculospora]